MTVKLYNYTYLISHIGQSLTEVRLKNGGENDVHAHGSSLRI